MKANEIFLAMRDWCNGRFAKKEDTLHSVTIEKTVIDEEWITVNTNKQYITLETGVKNIKSVTLQAPTPDFPCLPYITTTDGIIGVIAYTTAADVKKYKDIVLHVIYKKVDT